MAYDLCGWIEVRHEYGDDAEDYEYIAAFNITAFVDYGDSVVAGTLFGLAKVHPDDGPLHNRPMPHDCSREMQLIVDDMARFPGEMFGTWCTFDELRSEIARVRPLEPDFDAAFERSGWPHVLRIADQLEHDAWGNKRQVRFMLCGKW